MKDSELFTQNSILIKSVQIMCIKLNKKERQILILKLKRRTYFNPKFWNARII